MPDTGVASYAQVVTTEGAKQHIHIAGTLPFDINHNLIGVDDMTTQVRCVLANIDSSLREVGATRTNVARTKTYVTDAETYLRSGHDEYLHFFEGNLPASTTVVVAGLMHPQALVEIEAYAVM
ncbi:RidA family protein [Streptomyces sulphureus]|uniref:RidA family protein n=1 Tax=Streptomyces sulphureus TaxID=47758 RepID=UPI00131A40D2|nr:Rid family hydrolase [Streptomyces sulphureus]